jgi:hypothetical protein
MKRKHINILLANNFGGVGKSTIAACLLHPRVGGELLSIESNNTGAERYGLSIRRYAALQYREYYDDLRRFAFVGNTTTDVGASNIERFIERLREAGSHDRFDYYVVPATQTDRGQIESITTIQTLLDTLGVDPERIRIVFNMVKTHRVDGPIEAEFPLLFAFAAQDRRVKINPKCAIPSLDVFSLLATSGRSWQEVQNDKTDYDDVYAEAMATGDKVGQDVALRNQYLQELVAQAQNLMNQAWNQLGITLPVKSPASRAIATVDAMPESAKE